MAQLSNASFTMPLAQAGQIADASSRTVDSYASEGVVAFGSAVQRGTDPAKQVAPFTGGVFAGISVFSHTEETGQYEDKGSVAVMSSGRVVVDTLAVEVEAGEAAYAVDATGVITNVATSATAIGTFLTSGTGLNVIQVEV